MRNDKYAICTIEIAKTKREKKKHKTKESGTRKSGQPSSFPVETLERRGEIKNAL